MKNSPQPENRSRRGEGLRRAPRAVEEIGELEAQVIGEFAKLRDSKPGWITERPPAGANERVCIDVLGYNGNALEFLLKDVYNAGMYNEEVTAFANVLQIPEAMRERFFTDIKAAIAVAWCLVADKPDDAQSTDSKVLVTRDDLPDFIKKVFVEVIAFGNILTLPGAEVVRDRFSKDVRSAIAVAWSLVATETSETSTAAEPHLEAAPETATPRLEHAATETTATPRLKWETHRLPDEDPAHFAWRAYAAEAAAGKLHRGVISTEDPPLHRKLKNWLRTYDMPEGIDIPTLPEWNDRQVEKLAILRDDATVRETVRLAAVVARRRAQRMPGM